MSYLLIFIGSVPFMLIYLSGIMQAIRLRNVFYIFSAFFDNLYGKDNFNYIYIGALVILTLGLMLAKCKKKTWAFLLGFGLLPFIGILTSSIYHFFAGFAFLNSYEGFEAFKESFMFYSQYGFAMYAFGAPFILISIFKLLKKKKKKKIAV